MGSASACIGDKSLLLKDIGDREIAARVVNISAQLIADAAGRVPHETIVAVNAAASIHRHDVASACLDPRRMAPGIGSARYCLRY
jgi:hypothetical protein